MDHQLVERARRGDTDAFEALVHASVDRMYAVAFRVLRDADRTEDAVQQALVDMWDGLPGLRDADRFEAWTYRIAVRASYREARRDHHVAARVRDIDAFEAVAESPAAADPMIRIVSRDEMDEAFRQLTPEHRAVLVLRFYVGLPVNEIADTLEIPLGTAASRLHYALRDLRAACESADRGSDRGAPARILA